MKLKTWSVEIRDNCKICGEPLPNSRFRSFCSKKCRDKSNNKKQAGYSLEWQRAKRAKVASVASGDKCQCLICGGWYTGLKNHIASVHKN